MKQSKAWRVSLSSVEYTESSHDATEYFLEEIFNLRTDAMCYEEAKRQMIMFLSVEDVSE